MTHDVITFSVPIGSAGHEVARQVAQTAGLRYFDREVIFRAAALSGASPEAIAGAEHWPNFVDRIMEHISASAVDPESLLLASGSSGSGAMRTSRDYRAFIERVILNLAYEGRCVIVGHAGQAVLRDSPNVFKVLVHGSQEMRAQRLMTEESLSQTDALKRLTDDDCRRKKFLKCAYGIEWLASSNYDLTISADRLDPAAAANLVLNTLEERKRQLVAV